MFSLSSTAPSPPPSDTLSNPPSLTFTPPHFQPSNSHRRPLRPLRISNLHTPHHFQHPDHYITEAINRHYTPLPNLKIAIIGFGNFGQFLAGTLVRQGHTVIAHSRTDYSQPASNLGVSFFSDPHDLCEEHPDVILLCTSILSTEPVLRSLPLQRLKRNTLFVDVLSVKEFPRSLFLQLLPKDSDILCTHPMFGPDSGKGGWSGLPFMYDKVRIGNSKSRISRCQSFLEVFRREGCRMAEMSCADHDRYAAGSQFITHMTGRVLEEFNLQSTPIDTKGYESLLNLVDNTSKDSFELFYGLFLYNRNASEQLERMGMAFEVVRHQLMGKLQRTLRRQTMKEFEAVVEKKPQKLLPASARNGAVIFPVSSNVVKVDARR